MLICFIIILIHYCLIKYGFCSTDFTEEQSAALDKTKEKFEFQAEVSRLMDIMINRYVIILSILYIIVVSMLIIIDLISKKQVITCFLGLVTTTCHFFPQIEIPVNVRTHFAYIMMYTLILYISIPLLLYIHLFYVAAYTLKLKFSYVN